MLSAVIEASPGKGLGNSVVPGALSISLENGWSHGRIGNALAAV